MNVTSASRSRSDADRFHAAGRSDAGDRFDASDRFDADEDFTVTVHRDGQAHSVRARGWLTAAGGELLYSAIATVGRQRGQRLVADLSGVSGIDATGWAWLLPALQHCGAAGCELSIVPPATGGITLDGYDRQPAETPLSEVPPANVPVSEVPAPVQLRCYPDGPVLLRGDAELLDRDGRPLPRTGSAVALCRCGASSIKPFCDGSHKAIGFNDA